MKIMLFVTLISLPLFASEHHLAVPTGKAKVSEKVEENAKYTPILVVAEFRHGISFRASCALDNQVYIYTKSYNAFLKETYSHDASLPIFVKLRSMTMAAMALSVSGKMTDSWLYDRARFVESGKALNLEWSE